MLSRSDTLNPRYHLFNGLESDPTEEETRPILFVNKDGCAWQRTEAG